MNPLHNAEQAVLGSVLLDPEQLAHLTWLAPGHFDRPVHQALFAALRKLPDDGHHATTAETPVPLSWVTDAVDAAGLHVRGLTAVYAHTLVSACPHAAHAPVYGRMVLEGAIHRSITGHAIRLHQAARADALRGGVEGALHCADVLSGVLSDLAQRWGSEPRPVEPPPATAPVTAALAPLPVEAGQAVEDERFLLAVLTERQKAMDEVVDWLRPGDFSDPALGQLYRCLAALHHRGEPIDRITLLWEAQRRGLLSAGTLSGDQLTAICDGVGSGSAEWLGEQVLRSSVTRTAAASANAIRDLAENDALAPGHLISHALHALGPLTEVRTRWRAAQGHNAPQQPSSVPPPEAVPTGRVRAALARSASQHIPPEGDTPSRPSPHRLRAPGSQLTPQFPAAAPPSRT
ncbi:DnaB-like helicase N-terminal domain-containing protein [Streptomyces sp. NPDC002932]|uniref:DnaB-like helicase N-terminal domain-containing protein n=1 Tax=Streptomyces sp. NPDC002932 TaxID=3364672 RepID=UPI0036CA73D7